MSEENYLEDYLCGHYPNCTFTTPDYTEIGKHIAAAHNSELPEQTTIIEFKEAE